MGWWPGTGLKRVPAAAMLAALFCCARAPGATQFIGTPYSVALAHINHVGQASTGSTAIRLNHTGGCTLSVSAPQDKGEVLTLGGAGGGGPTLATSYKITGIADQDTDWVDSNAILSRTYTIPPGGGVTDLTLWVQGVAPSNSAPEAGAYTATIVLTVTF